MSDKRYLTRTAKNRQVSFSKASISGRVCLFEIKLCRCTSRGINNKLPQTKKPRMQTNKANVRVEVRFRPGEVGFINGRKVSQLSYPESFRSMFLYSAKL